MEYYYLSREVRSFRYSYKHEGVVRLAYGEWGVDGTRYVFGPRSVCANWQTWRVWSEVCEDDWTPVPSAETWQVWQEVM